jgi:formylglycine-generating enzyme required for sulfatase activity
MLVKGHHGVELDAEAWSRLYTWIDLNAPHRGMWNNQKYEKRRLDLSKLYAGLTDNPEEEYRQAVAMLNQNQPAKPIMPKSQAKPVPDGLTSPAFPFDAAKAKAMQGDGATMELPLGGDLTMKFIRIPAGQFVMGSQDGFPDEAPRAIVKIDKPFWMGACEVTNRQYAQYDPEHDTRYIDETGKDHSTPGYIANHDNQPVARISWQEAMRFCKWMSQKTGRGATLPTEAQWEWAARAGSATQFYYGDADTDFSKFANLADADRRNLYVSWDGGSKIHQRRPYPADYLFPLRDDRFKDNWFVVDYVGQCQPNAWGLNDMIGNATEWTRSSYRPYPYKADDGRNNADVSKAKAARGGSWFDRPKTAGASVRFRYESYQKVFNVGFRVIIE